MNDCGEIRFGERAGRWALSGPGAVSFALMTAEQTPAGRRRVFPLRYGHFVEVPPRSACLVERPCKLQRRGFGALILMNEVLLYATGPGMTVPFRNPNALEVGTMAAA